MATKKAAPKQTAAKLPNETTTAESLAAAAGVPADKQPEDDLAIKVEPNVTDEPLPVMDLQEDKSEPEAPVSPWMVVDELTDDKMVVEAANIQAHSRSSMLLRFSVEGVLSGFVQSIDRMHYKPGSKRNSFVTR